MDHATLTGLTADITVAYVAGNQIEPGEVPGLITGIYAALDRPATPIKVAPTYEPAVSIRSSVKPEHIISLIDGKPYKMLKRHLANHDITPDEYRARYGLPASYPMVAPSYSEKRRVLAKSIGLGRKLGTKMPRKAA